MNVNKFHNWCKLELLLTRVSEILRNIFKDEWFKKLQEKWDNSETLGKKFVETVGSQVYKSVGNIQKKSLKKGEKNR